MQLFVFRFAATAGLMIFCVRPAVADSCDPIRTFADGKTPMREVFVSPSGNNSIGNGSQANPYQTISPAAGKGKTLTAVRADALERCYANPPTIGAYEAKPPPIERADSDGDLMPDAWEQANGFDGDVPADAVQDADADGLSNLGEYLAETNPHDPLSYFAPRADPAAADGFSFRYSTLTGRVYRVESRALTTLAAWSEESVMNGTRGEISHLKSPLSTNAKIFRVKLELSP